MGTLSLMGCGPSAADPYSAYLVYDTLTDDDGVEMANHTPEKGGVWNVYNILSALVVINTNRAWFNANTTSHRSQVYQTTTASDVDIACIMTLGGTNPTLFARIDEDDAYSMHDCLYLNPCPAINELRLYSVVGLSYTKLGFVAQAYTAGDVIAVRFELHGTTVTGYDDTNGVDVSVESSVNLTEKSHGMGENVGNNACYFDDFTIKAA